MSQFAYQLAYQRRLPHLQPPGATFFVTFRLFDSVPKHVLQQWVSESSALQKQIATLNPESDKVRISQIREQIERAYFQKLERFLDTGDCGPRWLAEPAVAEIVRNALHFFDNKKYTMVAFCIMSNHVHILITPLKNGNGGEFISLAAIMHSLKRHTARECNKLLSRTGSFWATESFDHYVRDEAELSRTVRYILNNPVKAGLVSTCEDWLWNYPRSPKT